MTGIKVELGFPIDLVSSEITALLYHRQPDVGWVLDGGFSYSDVGEAEEGLLADLDSTYPENQEPT